ncbi:MAG: hypothetical protein K8T90_20305 [Planctomycetes bacterium]|nr:hypothetical protein [Planctomycetota bacterium]
MSQTIALELLIPDDMAGIRLPPGVDERLTFLLDRQDGGRRLSKAERLEAEGLVELTEMLTLLRLRAGQGASRRSKTS